MKKSTQWLGVFAIGICSVTALPGCSGDPVPSTMPMNTAGATSTGGTTGAGGMTGTQLQSPSYFVKLSGADAAAGPQPAPAVYTSATCATCHGPNGEGVQSLAPEIRFTPKDYAVSVVRKGRVSPNGMASAMVAFPAGATSGMGMLSDADLDAINTWQNSFTKPTTGQGLYLAMCGNCHGPTTPTGGSAPISIKGKSQVDVAMYVRNGNGTDLSMRAMYMPKFDTTLLSDTELASIVTYLNMP
jgi:mono/diheme cytochrome c family protein